MRKILVLFLCAAILISVLSACEKNESDPIALPVGDGLVLTVVYADKDIVYLAGENDYDIYTIKAAGYKIIRDGKESDHGLNAGEIIKTDGKYAVEESLPAHLWSDTVTVLESKPPIYDLVMSVYDDLMETDSGLNGGITSLYYNRIDNKYMTDGEQSTLGYIYTARRGLTMSYDIGTFDELCDKGLIDRENLQCDDGLFMSFDIKSVSKNTVKFNASKWRSGTGAYFFGDCKATYKDGSWSYTVGTEAIS